MNLLSGQKSKAAGSSFLMVVAPKWLVFTSVASPKPKPVGRSFPHWPSHTTARDPFADPRLSDGQKGGCWKAAK